MKFVKLTNYADGRQGDQIVINIDHIIAVYEDQTPGGGLVTKVYGGPMGIVWSIEESLKEAVTKIEEAANG